MRLSPSPCAIAASVRMLQGTITIRGEPFEIDDTLVYFTKQIVDLAPGRSS